MEFSKKMLVLHICISVLLCITTIVGTLTENENRAKYAQRFLNKFADKYGADAALRAAEIVLKD